MQDLNQTYGLIDPRAGKIVARKEYVEFFAPRTEELGKIPVCSIADLYDSYTSL